MLILNRLKLSKTTCQTEGNGTKNFKIMIPLKCNFWRTLEMSLINFEINLNLNWFKNYIIVANNENQDAAFSITDTILYVPIMTLSTQNNA